MGRLDGFEGEICLFGMSSDEEDRCEGLRETSGFCTNGKWEKR